ncbi:MAG: hypothetical protein ACR2PW_04635 [Gammaproteobacteria bacterium]
MTLEEWVDEERKRIDRFTTMYRMGRKKAPAFYPEQLEPGEWDEQYRMFDQ